MHMLNLPRCSRHVGFLRLRRPPCMLWLQSQLHSNWQGGSCLSLAPKSLTKAKMNRQLGTAGLQSTPDLVFLRDGVRSGLHAHASHAKDSLTDRTRSCARLKPAVCHLQLRLIFTSKKLCVATNPQDSIACTCKIDPAVV